MRIYFAVSQQIYNHMIDEQRLIHATIVAENTLSEVLANVSQRIAINEFAKRNQPSFILHSNNHIIESNFQHLYNLPTKCPSKYDQQPSNIPLDSMMSVGLVEESPSKSSQSRIARTITSEINSLKLKKRESINSSKNGQSYKASARKQVVNKFQRISNQQNNQNNNEDFQLQRLRQLKAHQEFLKLNQKVVIKPKVECKLSKGQAIVFDYEGNFSKRKELVNKYFNNSIVEGQVTNHEENNKKMVLSKQMQPSQEAESIPVASTRRAENNKLKSSLTGKEISFRTENYEEEILRSIQIRERGIKVIVDGQVAQLTQQLKEKQAKQSSPNPKPHTIQMKRINLNSNQRFKTEVLPESSNIIDIPDTKRSSNRVKARSGMQKSIARPSVADKISVQNCFLQKMILENPNDAEIKYKELPTNRSQRRRVKTNIEAEIHKDNTDFERLKIKQRLMSSTRQGDKLPRIISQHRKAEMQILREVRQKKFLF